MPPVREKFTAELPKTELARSSAGPPAVPKRTIAAQSRRVPETPSAIGRFTGFVGETVRRRQERKTELALRQQEVIAAQEIQRQQMLAAQQAAEMAPKPCPFCEEPVLPTSKKCKHCGEYLDPAYRPGAQASIPQVVINNNNSSNVGYARAPYPRWSPGVAALLSFLIPGAGQIYKGQPINGIVWFILTALGYVAFIIPGIVLHLCCVIGAAMGDPYR